MTVRKSPAAVPIAASPYAASCPVQRGEILSSGLRLRSGREDGPLVILQDSEPARQIGGCVVARIMRHAQVGAQERCRELLDGVAFTAEPARQIAVQAMLCSGPMRNLV